MLMRRIKILLFVFSFLLGGTLFAQTIVRGTISDAQGVTLPGVNILEVGTTNGTVTDVNGDYSLQVAGSEAVLEFSYIGFETQTVTVGSQSTINITLTIGTLRLDEVIVTAFGFTVKKDETAQVSSSVRGEDIVSSGESMLLN